MAISEGYRYLDAKALFVAMAGEGGDAQLECGGALQGDHVRLSHKQRLGRGGLRKKQSGGVGGSREQLLRKLGGEAVRKW